MKVKVTKEFVAGAETYPAGQSADLADEVADRVIGIGWAEPEEVDDKKPKNKGSFQKKHDSTGE
ncbi:Hypothetical protein DPCES_5359 [Desulfitobacterium hafniense]|uniref:Uncharacterized protein n=1 Tax=Desulfitobacterium hafniense TaxID=49338 RepID=A0A098AW28_DESHA|nr:hypothetical protein [Desulfitobacterium hafniense]CDV96357.1 Hypothetical protein DPCES_5359 [Desulfitobacterium hafniense]